MKRYNKPSSRRAFLQALGVSATATPWLAGRAWAQESTDTRSHSNPGKPEAGTGDKEPLRFIGVFMPHGVAREHFEPKPGFDVSYEGCSLAPFDDAQRFARSYREQIAVIDGVDLAAGIEVGTVGHDASRVILTGSGARGTNASIDQYLAVEQGLGATTPLTSLVLGVGNDDTGLGYNLSYSRGGTPVPKIIDPVVLFDELFGKPLSRAEQRALEQRRLTGRSVLDMLRHDLQRLGHTAPASERDKLEQHQTALREIEKRLAPLARNCAAPARPDANAFPSLLAFSGGEQYFDVITNLHMDLIARAFACDLTRFVTLFLGDLTRTPLAMGLPPDVHMEVAHRYSASENGSGGQPESWRALATQNRYTYGQVAGLMQRLDQAQVLNDTVIYASSDMGDPARHSSREVPTLIAGGCGGHFKLGRYLDLRGTKKPGQLLPNNRVLVSIAQAFGVETERFGFSGSPETVEGRLDALHA